MDHLDALYVSWEEAMYPDPLDGLIITGAPVEHLPYEEVYYWSEFVELIDEARRCCASTLGLCWAGFALAYLAGVEKQCFEHVFKWRLLQEKKLRATSKGKKTMNDIEIKNFIMYYEIF